MNFIADATTAIPKLAHTLAPSFEQAAKDGPEMVETLLSVTLARFALLVTIESIDRASWELNQSATLDEAKERMRGYWAEYSTVALQYPLAGAELAVPKGTFPLGKELATPTPTPPPPAPEAPAFTHSPRAHNPFGYL